MIFGIFTIITAIAISSVAAYFSIIGLSTLFAATFWGVVIMAAWLEIGKIVATKWVHSNWRTTSSPRLLKGLMCVFIATLMIITSLGIYGYLSKGHLEQSAPKAGIEIQVSQIESQINQRLEENERLSIRLEQINRITDRVLETNARQGLRASQQQKREADEIQKRIDENYTKINELNESLVPLKMENSSVEAKLGPIKYVAELFGWEDPEVAVRLLIILIMIAFDPLALSLFIAGSISIRDHRNRKNEKAQESNVEIIEPDNEEEGVQRHPNSDIHEAAIKSRLEEVSKKETELLEMANRLEELNEYLDQKDKDLEKRESDIEAKEKYQADTEQDLENLAKVLENKSKELAKREDDLLHLEASMVQTETDDRSDRQIILDMLEKNPDVLQDIIDVIGTHQPKNK